MEIDMIVEKLRGKKIIIFGTGNVAHRFYTILESYGMQGQVACFTRTGDVNDGEKFEERPVYCFKELFIDSDTLVCLAVHECIRDEVEQIVRQRTDQYIWIYPYLFSLVLGEPEQNNVELDVRKLLKGFSKDLYLGVRLAAIEQHEGMNCYGFDYYVRALMIYCNEDTAKQRLNQFLNLITKWKQSGYDKNQLIYLTHDYKLVDGCHRLSMAVYTKQKIIYGNVYPISTEAIVGYDEALLSKELLQRNGFVTSEIERLEKIQEKYIEYYERL